MKCILLSIAIIVSASVQAWAETDTQATPQDIKVFNGRLIDASDNGRIPYATVWMRGTSVSVVSNGDGDFSLKIPAEYKTDTIYVKHIGYRQKAVMLAPDTERRNTILLNEAVTPIGEVVVNPVEPLQVLKTAIQKIKDNYRTSPQRLVGFYREMIMKNNRYVSIVEAIPDIYKAPTTNPGGDRIRLYKGRRSLDDSRVDTLIMKYRGGLTTALELDIAKRYDMVFVSPDSIERYYVLNMEEPTEIQGRPQYVISFNQVDYVRKPMMYRGKVYVDRESMAISRCEYYMNVEEHADAYQTFIVSLPVRYRINMLEVKLLIDYKYDDGIWDYSYSSLEMAMRLRSDKRKFNARYTIISELVITDRGDGNAEKFPSKERLRTNDLVFDRIIDYDDDSFWEGYNSIEPEQTIENAVRRLNRNVNVQEVQEQDGQ